MSDFPDIGENCNVETCNQLDFLPIVCAYCSNIFCKNHGLPQNHQCPNLIDRTNEPIRESAPIRTYPCTKKDCKRKELVPISCFSCRQHFCIQHRFPNDHECPKLDCNISTVTSTSKSQDDQKPNIDYSLQQEKWSHLKKDSISTKVALMKLKMTSLGPAMTLPMEERVYFYVQLPQWCKIKGAVLPIAFSKEWQIGKCIDVVLALADLKLIWQEKKLRLFAKKDGQFDLLSIAATMKEIMDCKLVEDCDTIYAMYL